MIWSAMEERELAGGWREEIQNLFWGYTEHEQF